MKNTIIICTTAIICTSILATPALATETTNRFKIVVAPDFRHPASDITYLIDQETGDTWYAAPMPVQTSGTNSTTYLVWVPAFVIKQDSPITPPIITTMKGYQNTNNDSVMGLPTTAKKPQEPKLVPASGNPFDSLNP